MATTLSELRRARSVRPRSDRPRSGHGGLRRLWQGLRDSYQRQRTQRLLRQLPDHLLADIGLSRSEVGEPLDEAGHWLEQVDEPVYRLLRRRRP